MCQERTLIGKDVTVITDVRPSGTDTHVCQDGGEGGVCSYLLTVYIHSVISVVVTLIFVLVLTKSLILFKTSVLG